MTALPRNPYPVVYGDVATDEPPIEMRWMRGKPVPKVISRTPSSKTNPANGHRQPLTLPDPSNLLYF